MATTASIPQNIDDIRVYRSRTVVIASLVLADTSKIGASATEIFAADTNGSYCEYLTVCSRGTNPKTVFRVFYKTAASQGLIYEVTLEETAATETDALPMYRIAIQRKMLSGEKIFVSIGTSGTDGWAVSSYGGDY